VEYSPSLQDVSWFKNQYLNGALEIRPPYQRKPVWTPRQKCYLVETILKNLPIPEIYVQKTMTPEGKATYAIVDGQQRIRTVLQFIGVDNEKGEQASNQFALDKLPSHSPWKDSTFDDLSDSDKNYCYHKMITYIRDNNK